MQNVSLLCYVTTPSNFKISMDIYLEKICFNLPLHRHRQADCGHDDAIIPHPRDALSFVSIMEGMVRYNTVALPEWDTLNPNWIIRQCWWLHSALGSKGLGRESSIVDRWVDCGRLWCGASFSVDGGVRQEVRTNPVGRNCCVTGGEKVILLYACFQLGWLRAGGASQQFALLNNLISLLIATRFFCR